MFVCLVALWHVCALVCLVAFGLCVCVCVCLCVREGSLSRPVETLRVQCVLSRILNNPQ